jgi:hypothetical protein
MKTLTAPSFGQLKKAFLDSGYEIRFFPARELEHLALDAPLEVKRHLNSNIMGLIMPDEQTIGIAAELSTDERAATLLHELIHLFNEDMEESEVENLTLDLEESLSKDEFGFLQFLVA